MCHEDGAGLGGRPTKCTTLSRLLSQSFLLSTACVALVGSTASFNTDGVNMVLIDCLSPAAVPTGGDHDEGKEPTVPHLLDGLVAPFGADGVDSVVVLQCRAPAAASTDEGRDEGEVQDVSRP